jgi:hypothetical protein
MRLEGSPLIQSPAIYFSIGWLDLRTIAAIFVYITLAACNQHGLSAKELFSLRTECGDKAASLSTHGSITVPGELTTVRGHYDEGANRCLLKIKTINVLDASSSNIVTDDALMDSQSRAILAKCQNTSQQVLDGNIYRHETSGSCEIDGRTVAQDQYDSFVDKRMGEDK